MPTLNFFQPEFGNQSWELPEGRSRVGRCPECDLVIRDESVSAQHCEILVNWNEVIVRECGSRNGTWVGGRPVAGQLPVNHGQVIRFGRVEARLELAEPSAADPTEHTTFLLRQQVSWSESSERPRHVVIEARGSPGDISADTLGLTAPPRPAQDAPASRDKSGEVQSPGIRPHEWGLWILGGGLALGLLAAGLLAIGS